MRFLDEAVITVSSGHGGRGCVSFRREKFIPKGGPDGGDGGNGGDIIIRASGKLHTLYDFSSRNNFKARNGQPGEGKNKTGKTGRNIVIEVPLGTIIHDHDTGEKLADLIEENQKIFLLPGGTGGKGNRHFATSTNRAPRTAQPGLPGQQKKLDLSLKYIADIGIIGLPNTGKSTLLSQLTMAHPRIASYPFSTLNPNLGVIAFNDETSLTMADIPGLIEGAGKGRGLGHNFLKHIERSRLLLHLLDITYIPGHNILEDFYAVRREMEEFNPSLVRKNQIVLINKIDIHSTGQRDVSDLQDALSDIGLESMPVSALTGEGLENLKRILSRVFINNG